VLSVSQLNVVFVNTPTYCAVTVRESGIIPMGMDVYTVNDREESNLKPSDTSQLAVSNGEDGIIETDVFTNMLTRLEIDLAYSSEKLVNLDHYMTVVSLEDNRFREWSQSQISEEDIERDLISDLLFGYIDSEVTELEHGLSILQAKITSAHQKIYPCEGHTEEPNAFQQKKLHQFGNSWKDLQEKVSKMKQHLAQLHRTLSIIRPNDCSKLSWRKSFLPLFPSLPPLRATCKC